jgi:hypothetical protein
MRNRSLLAPLVLGLSLFAATSTSAKVTSESGYSRAQTLNGALRFIRVDQGLEIVEKDLDTGYFLFSYKGGSGAAMGSIQVLEVNGRVKFVVQIPKYPQYHEQVLTKGIRDKLLEEYGEPPARETPKPKEPPPAERAPAEKKPAEAGSEKPNSAD